ncbi:GNAT family N-acetyltransferase [Sphingomonas sp. 28-62-20]|uniref:GNAT family N-acetyltransferase n=1 Tax=Sphingomonas sp. 28-62-20 TaxID=1970433 RepID=UPI0026C897D2
MAATALCRTEQCLFEDRDRWARQPDAYSQGRTLGLLQVRAAQLPARLGAVSRVLLHGTGIGDRDAVLDRLAQIGARGIKRLTLVARRIEAPMPGDRCVRLGSGWAVTAQALQRAAGIVPVPAWILRGEDGRTVTIGVIADGQLGAVACVQPVPALLTDAGVAMLFGVAVAPGHRRQGIGRRLIATASDIGAEMGAAMLCEIVEPWNPAALALAASAGFISREADWVVFAALRDAR